MTTAGALATRPVDDLVAAVDRGGTEAVAVFARLVDEEDALVFANRLEPYLDKVPAVVGACAVTTMGEVLGGLDTSRCRRALFGNYTRVPDARLGDLLSAMPPAAAARLVETMCVGTDAPREIARVLAGMAGDALSEVAPELHPAGVIRLLDELELLQQRRLLAGMRPTAAAGVVATLLQEGGLVGARQADLLLDGLPAEVGAWAVLAVDGGEAALSRARETWPPPSARLREVRVDLEDAEPDLAVSRLLELDPGSAAEAIRSLAPLRAARILRTLGTTRPVLARDLLAAADRRVLLRAPRPGVAPAWSVRTETSSAIMAALGKARPPAAALPRLDGGAVGGRGRQEVRHLDAGTRWVRIEERLDNGRWVKPVVIDLLELDLDRVRLAACIASNDRTALPVAAAAARFDVYRRDGRRPGNEMFAELGLVQLSQAVGAAGAIAGINGNFYFDYGHYLNGVTLGIDIASVPGLFFGDPIGWFVSGGRELVPPAFNRAAAVVTADGHLHIERVFLTGVTFPSGVTIADAAVNELAPTGRAAVFTSLWGARTPPSDEHVDVAVARGHVWAVEPGGETTIPLTGFVLSVPAGHPALRGTVPGTAVIVHHNLPPGRGEVREAMACGPQLIRNGIVDVDFATEDFGQQDGTVMSFFLPRTVETYEAARSFMATRDRTLVLGTVSGTAYGFGRSNYSAGFTFGELAQLCADLDVDHALALDGGGSSSLVATDAGQPRVLNAPTGGFDVAPGEERFINTYWLVFDSQESRSDA